MMDKRNSFIMVGNHQAVKVGDLEKTMQSRPVVKPKFTTDFPEAVVLEGTDELTLRAEEGMWRTVISTPRMRTPLADMRTGTPSARPFSKGVEGSERV